MEKIKYPSINGLRAISIILVINFHLQLIPETFPELIKSKWTTSLVTFAQDGSLGVNIFFVISGFLITSLLLNEEEHTHTISLKKFYIRRILRIFPAYYFLLLVYAILQFAGFIHISALSWITAITYTKYINPLLYGGDWITGHAWSLSVEEFFYLLWPFIFLRGYSFRKKVIIATILIIPLIRALFHFYPTITWLHLSIFTRIDSIAMGCLFALYKNKIVNVIKSPHLNILFFSSIVILFFSSEIMPYLIVKYIPNSSLIALSKAIGTSVGTIANASIGFILMYSIFGPQNIWFKILNSKTLNYTGLLSYSLYLWQQIFIYNDLELKYWAVNFPQKIISIFVMALFSYYVIEKPFLKLKDKFL